jgi:hypothetical protein
MAVQSLGELLFATQADGSRLYADADVADALPLLVFMLQLPIDTLPKPVHALFIQGCIGAGLVGTETPAEVGEKIGAKYADSAIKPELMAALDAWARASLVEATTPEDKGRLSAFLGSSQPKGVLGGGARPAGTTPGGVLARFAKVPPRETK